MKPTIYAMVGTIGSGKTTYAKKVAAEKHALLFCIDENIKQLGQPIKSKEDYDKYYFGVRAIITDQAIKALKLSLSVVFDFGGSISHFEWLQSIAQKTQSDIEIFHLMAPIEIRRERVKARNSDSDTIFRFSDSEFNAMPVESAAPPIQPGLKVTVVNTAEGRS